MQARGRWQSEHCWADYRMLSQTDSAGLTCVRFSVRTFQRRVQQWRGIMANQLVYVASETTPYRAANARRNPVYDQGVASAVGSLLSD